jgi:cytochrome b561
MATPEFPVTKWSRPLRLIHFLLAATVTAQLFIGSFMRSPRPGRPDSFGFMSHEAIGATILALVAVHWLWSFSHPDEGIRHLFPWTRTGMRNIVDELRQAIRHRRMQPGGPGHAGLAGFVHGLGLIAISAVAIAGGAFYLSRLLGVGHHALKLIEDIHDTFAVVAWGYWGGHLAATIVHSLLRRPVWRRMFGWEA